jgi:benzoate transport
MTAQFKDVIAERPMTAFQWRAVALCILLNLLDGFDVLVMAFTGRAVSAEWGLTATQLGLLLSAGLVGMGIGSLFVAPWADRLGRRPVTLVCIVVITVGMLLSAASQSAGQLGAFRVLTGIGIGGILATSIVIAAEYSSRRWRGLAVSLNSAGYAIGATVGGLLAVLLIDQFGWRTVFLVGGLLSAAALPLIWWGLPESLDFLTTRFPSRALERANSILVRMGHDPLDTLLPSDGGHRGVAAGFRRLVASGLRRNTLLVCGTYLCVLAGFHFVTSWTPSLLVDAGLSSAAGISGGTLLNVGGILGSAAVGLLAARFVLRSVLTTFMFVAAMLLAVFIGTTPWIVLALVVAVVVGALVNGCVAGLNALAPTLYDPDMRVTAVGTALTFGRVGSILSPTVAGALLDAGWAPTHLYLMAGGVFAVAGALVLAVHLGDPAGRADHAVQTPVGPSGAAAP